MKAPRITPDDVRRRLAIGEKVVFVDARSEDSYRASEVQLSGALRVPPDDAELYVNELPGNALTVSYCT